MKKIINDIENRAIRKYGFESNKTVLTFKATAILRKAFKIQ